MLGFGVHLCTHTSQPSFLIRQNAAGRNAKQVISLWLCYLFDEGRRSIRLSCGILHVRYTNILFDVIDSFRTAMHARGTCTGV